MKHVKIFLLLFALSIAGCSRHYVMQDFDSPKEFYNELSKKCSGNYSELEFTNGKSANVFNLTFGDDSVYWMEYRNGYKNVSIPIKDIAALQNEGQNADYVKLLTKSGDSFLVKDIIKKNDSLFCTARENFRMSYPINNISSVIVVNRFWGTLSGFALGTITGIFFGPAITGPYGNSGDSFSPFYGIIIGGIAGIVTGAIKGSNEVYIIHNRREQ